MNPTGPRCWTWDVDPVVLQLAGPFQLRWYGLAFLATFVAGFLLLRWQMVRAGRGTTAALQFANYGMVGLVAGAWLVDRLFYDFGRVLADPASVFDLSAGLTGLSSHGAAAGLMSAMWLYARRTRIPLGEMFDRFSFSAASGAALVRLGNFFNSEVVGRAVEGGAWWAVCLPRHDRSPPWGSAAPVPRHPSQLYEAAIGVAVLLLLVAVDRAAGGERRPRWLLAGTFLVAYFTLRIGVEYFKQPYVFAADRWDMGQWLSLPFLLAGLACWWLAWTRRLPARGGD